MGGELKKDVSLVGIVALGAGTAIGVSVFSILAPGAELAGAGMLLSMLIAGLPMILFAVTYAFMGSAVPTSGASYEWPRRFVHPFLGFIVGWLRIAGSTSALLLYAFVLVQYWSMLVAVPAKPAIFVILTLFFVLNTLGVSLVARGQSVMIFVLLVTCAVLVVSSFPVVRTENFAAPLSHGWSGVFTAVPLMVSLFLGIETATEVGEEVRDSRRTIPKGIALSILLTAAVYFVVASAAIGVLGPGRLAASDAPLLELARDSIGELGTPLILVSATVAIGTSLNATYLVYSRFLFAMGRSGILPGALARIHPRRGTPWVATTTVFGMCCVGLLLPSNLIFLFLAVNIPILLKYGATCLSAIRLARRHPDIRENAGIPLKQSTVVSWAGAGVVCAVIVILLGLQADWRPYAVLLVWGAVGCGWYFTRGLRRAPDIADAGKESAG